MDFLTVLVTVSINQSTMITKNPESLMIKKVISLSDSSYYMPYVANLTADANQLETSFFVVECLLLLLVIVVIAAFRRRGDNDL